MANRGDTGDDQGDDDSRKPSDPDSMGVYFAPKGFRYTSIAKDVADMYSDDGITQTCVLSAGEKFLYVLPDFDVLMIELRHLRVKGFPKANPEDVYDIFIKNDASLCRFLPAGIIIKDLAILKKEDFNEKLLNLPPLGVVVIWEWIWEDDVTRTSSQDENVSHISETNITHVSDSSVNGHQEEDSIKNDSDATNCAEEIQHTVTFKCIGVKYVPNSKETLRKVSQLLLQGDIVPVNIYPEPNNPRDSRAIVFKCWLDDQWHKIGYIVTEALDDVHKARDQGEIINVSFKWAQFLSVWSDSGPGYYAGINITKRGKWSRTICACASTR